MKTLILLATIIISGCQGMKVGVYHDFAGHTMGDKQVFMFEAPLYRMNENVQCNYRHESKIFTGAPFNSDLEGTLDMVGCSYEFN